MNTKANSGAVFSQGECEFMPELPEVETVRRGLAPVMEGARLTKVILNRQNLRFPFPDDFVAKLEGQRVKLLGRRAKYLLMYMANGVVAIMHLGMSGSFRVELPEGVEMPGAYYLPRSEARSHDHVILELSGAQGSARIIYNDPRRFGFMDLVNDDDLETCKHFINMGVEPTGNALNGEIISHIFTDKQTPLKSALLDQKLIAGLGNIYVCEALWRAGLSPRRKAKTISRKNGKATARSEALAKHIRDVIREAIDAGGSSLRDHRQTNGELGYFQHQFKVYDQEGKPCPKHGCEGTIERIAQSGRSTFFCAHCQR